MNASRVISVRKLILVGGFLLLAAQWSLPTAYGQSPEPADILRIDTDLVNLNVSVSSRKAPAPSVTLEQKNFVVLDNGTPQEISFFAANDAPFDLVLLLDLSGSTADKIGLIRKSAKKFVDAARPGDRSHGRRWSSNLLVPATPRLP